MLFLPSHWVWCQFWPSFFMGMIWWPLNYCPPGHKISSRSHLAWVFWRIQRLSKTLIDIMRCKKSCPTAFLDLRGGLLAPRGTQPRDRAETRDTSKMKRSHPDLQESRESWKRKIMPEHLCFTVLKVVEKRPPLSTTNFSSSHGCITYLWRSKGCLIVFFAGYVLSQLHSNSVRHRPFFADHRTS